MPSIEQQNNKRIAKNTLLLYFRMLLVMGVSLYTSRIVLRTLGVDDFGIYNVVGGLVAMFSVVSGALSSAISRFLTFELGKGDEEQLSKVFSSSVSIQILISLIVIVLAETIGLWFLNHQMVIPFDRLESANWIFHLSILTFCVNLISVPYNAAIVAHEKMSVFAYVSVFDALGKLAVAWGIAFSSVDKLIMYGLLMCCVSLFVRLIYGWYCKRYFKECNCRFVCDWSLLKRMFVFAGWNFVGSSSFILREQGGSIVLNLFCGPAVNAAKGIATQINNAVYQFVYNFTMALNPQITKSYAIGDMPYMMKLVFQGARLSFYIFSLLAIPVILNVRYILNLWLHVVPEYSTIFVQLVLVFTLSESISLPLQTVMLATGKIRNYQLVVGGLQLLNLPISYVLLKMGFAPESVFVVAIFLSQICLFARFFLLKKMVSFDTVSFIKKVYLNVCYVSVIGLIVPVTLCCFIQRDSFIKFALSFAVAGLSMFFSILFVGCSREERMFVFRKICEIGKKVFRQ